MNKLGYNISNLLEIHSMSKTDLARKVGITTPSVARYISGKRIPNIDTVVKIARVFDVSVDDLVGNSQTNKNPNIEYDIVRYSIKSNAKNWTNDQKAKLVDLLFDLE